MVRPNNIAIVGGRGAGKDVGGRHLEEHGYLHISVGDVVRSEARRLGIGEDRESLVRHSAEQRALRGDAYFTLRAIELYRGSKDYYDGLVASGLRYKDEATFFKALPGTIVFVEADDKLRLVRINDRAREGEQCASVEELLEDEARAYQLDQIRPMADISITNDGTEKEFLDKLDQILDL